MTDEIAALCNRPIIAWPVTDVVAAAGTGKQRLFKLWPMIQIKGLPAMWPWVAAVAIKMYYCYNIVFPIDIIIQLTATAATT